MKRIQLLVLHLLLIASPIAAQYKTLHDFTARTIEGELLNFSSLEGKKVLIVNIATECSLSPQLKKMQQLYEEYGGDDFEIVAFPCNDFGNQEPGNNEQIKNYCKEKFNLSFILMEKISIKGENIHPIYRWLINSDENGVLDGKVIWNFQKFLIDKNGQPVDFLSPISGPQNRRIMEWLQE